MPENRSLVSIRDFRLKSRESRTGHPMVLDIQALDLVAGDVFALIGRSGAGKSVLLCLLMGYPSGKLESAEVGRFHFFDSELDAGCFSKTVSIHRRMSRILRNGALVYLPQQFPACRDKGLSVRNILSPLMDVSLREVGADWKNPDFQIECAFEKYEIGSFLNKNMSDLSGGERRRVELAVRLWAIEKGNKPAVVLLDEPMTGLDAASAKDFMKFLRDSITKANENASVAALVSSHDLKVLDDENSQCVLLHRDPDDQKDIPEGACLNEHSFDSTVGRVLFFGKSKTLPERLKMEGFRSFAEDGEKIFETLRTVSSKNWVARLRES